MTPEEFAKRHGKFMKRMKARQKQTAILIWTVLWLNVLKVWDIKMDVIFCSV